MNTQIRQARPADARGISALDASVSHNPFSLVQAEQACSTSDAFSQAIVLTSSGAIQGFLAYARAVDDVTILALSVSEEAQGAGFGTRLLNEALSRMQLAGADACLLEVCASNAIARKLYCACGFTEDGLRKDYYLCVDGREDAVLMSFNFKVVDRECT